PALGGCVHPARVLEMEVRSLPRTRLCGGPILHRSGHRASVPSWQDDPVPTPPPPDVVALHDHSPDEIESPEELRYHLRSGSLAGKTVQGLDLSAVDLSAVDVRDALFIGCHFAQLDAVVDLLRRRAVVVPEFAGLPYPTHPSQLYTPENL